MTDTDRAAVHRGGRLVGAVGQGVRPRHLTAHPNAERPTPSRGWGVQRFRAAGAGVTPLSGR